MRLLPVALAVAVVGLILAGAVLFTQISSFSGRMTAISDAAALKGVPGVSRSGMFDLAWQRDLEPSLVASMTRTPAGWPGDFAALTAGDTIHFFQRDGADLRTFKAPTNTDWIAGDPTGAMPFLAVVSREYQMSGIDRLVRTSFLHALDVSGRVLWTRSYASNRNQPGFNATLAQLAGMPVILAISGEQLLCIDLQGQTLCSHPFQRSARMTIFTGIVNGQEPEYVATFPVARERLGVEQNGRRLEIPLSFSSYQLMAARALASGGPTEVALSRHYLKPAGGVGGALTFVQFPAGNSYEATFDGDALTLAIDPLDTDGDGTSVWLSASNDGTLRVVSPGADSGATEQTGARLHGMLVLPGSPPLVVVSTHRGVAAWRPTPALIGRYE